MPDIRHNVFDIVRMPQHIMAHATARRIGCLTILNVEPGRCKIVERAGMVIMEMGQNNIVESPEIDNLQFEGRCTLYCFGSEMKSMHSKVKGPWTALLRP